MSGFWGFGRGSRSRDGETSGDYGPRVTARSDVGERGAVVGAEMKRVSDAVGAAGEKGGAVPSADDVTRAEDPVHEGSE